VQRRTNERADRVDEKALCLVELDQMFAVAAFSGAGGQRDY
jgi:hypothetical protein